MEPQSNSLYSERAERFFIGAVLNSPNAARMMPALNAGDFAVSNCRKLFNAMAALFNQKRPIDLVTLDEILQQQEKGQAEALLQYAMNCAQGVISAARVETYVERIRACSLRRKVLALGEAISRDIAAPEIDTQTIIEQAREGLRSLTATRTQWQSMDDVLLSAYGQLERRMKGEESAIPTGLADLDKFIGGLYAGELTIIGARPAVGKSAFGMHLALNAAQHGVKVCYVTLEMVDVQFGQRLLANGAWVDGMKFRTAGLSDEDWASIAQAMGQMSGLPISFARIRYIEDLSAEIRRKVDMGECGMLVVDYLQLMDCKEKISSNRDDLRVAKISRGLKNLSTDCNIPVVALAQVKRSATGCPTLSDLRDSGAIEQDADGVIFMHRPENAGDEAIMRADREYFDAINASGYQYIVLSAAKQRQGRIGRTGVIFDPAHMDYRCVGRMEA